MKYILRLVKSPTCGLHLEFPLAITTKFSTDVAKHCAKLYESHINSADSIYYNKTILPGDILIYNMFSLHIFGHASLALSHLSSNGVFTLDAATNYYRLHKSKHPYFTPLGGSSLHTCVYSPTYVARTVQKYGFYPYFWTVDFATTWPTTLNRILNNIPTIWKRKHVWIYGPHVYETDFTTSDVFGIKSVASPTTTPEAIDVVVATSAS